jgi:putative methionine-R-sulfoxide reductase with GAF domain
VEKEVVSEEKNKPVFDEQTLAKLLEAAYVLQEHNRRLQEMELCVEPHAASADAELPMPAPLAPSRAGVESPKEQSAEHGRDDYTQTLAQIVETQHQIQVRHLELDAAMAMVAERVIEIARASGAAIGIVDEKKVRYRATAGLLTLPQGTEVPVEKALCVASLRTGQVIRCIDVRTEFLLDAEECHRRNIESLIAVPVYHDGGIAGALELYYPHVQAFGEQDVHTCQLMAGLVTEALARAEELVWKKSLADERAVMLEALERLKPNLSALVDASTRHSSAAKTDARVVGSAAGSPGDSVCRKCGNRLVGEEQFCGKCGLPRSDDYEPPNMQTKVASLWHMQEATRNATPSAPVNGDLPHTPPLLTNETAAESVSRTEDHERESENYLPKDYLSKDYPRDEQIDGPPVLPSSRDSHSLHALAKTAAETPDTEEEDEARAPIEHVPNWSSAATARDFLEQLQTPPGALTRFWNTRRGDIYLAIAVILVIGVIRWGIWSNPSVGASRSQSAVASQHKSVDSDLSFFDRILISLGLADAPDPPEFKGNPDTQVWVDLQTALYYCPGADLYGKTPKGRFASQRDAQLDQFEPASRKACN